MSLLELSNISAFYGGSQALFDVSLSLSQGEVLALMGRNGMGKSTTVKSICRMVESRGPITFDGKDVTQLRSNQVAQLGIGLVPEGRRCFANLTVEENLIAAARAGDWTLSSVGQFFPRLEERLAQMAGSLSGGEQQMLAIGRALMTNPRVLILDEATEGLAPLIRQEIWRALHTLKKETGMAILVIDKSVRELSAIADKAVILQRGKSVWTGEIDELTSEISETLIGV